TCPPKTRGTRVGLDWPRKMSTSIRSRSSRSRRSSSASLIRRTPCAPRSRTRARPSSRTGSQPHALRDDHLHDLARATVDAVDAVVRVEAGDRILVHVAVTAVQLEAAVDD